MAYRIVLKGGAWVVNSAAGAIEAGIGTPGGRHLYLLGPGWLWRVV